MSLVPPIANSLQPLSTSPHTAAPGLGKVDPGTGGFSTLVKGMIQDTNSAQAASDSLVADLVEGRTDNLQQVVFAVAKAEMSFQLFMEVRNQVIESYNELMRMQF